MADRRTFRVDALVSASRPFKAFLFPFRARPKEPTSKVESLYCHDNEMFSLVSQMVIAQPPSANKKKAVQDPRCPRERLARLEKVMVCVSLSVSRVYTFRNDTIDMSQNPHRDHRV
jgi:hypothetical protein